MQALSSTGQLKIGMSAVSPSVWVTSKLFVAGVSNLVFSCSDLFYPCTNLSVGDDVSDKCDQDGGEQKECDVPTGEAMEYFHKYCCDVITSSKFTPPTH